MLGSITELQLSDSDGDFECAVVFRIAKIVRIEYSGVVFRFREFLDL